MSAFLKKWRFGIRPASLALGVAAMAVMAAPAAQADFGFATFSAYIKDNGDAANASGVQSSARTGNGKYYVHFTREVRQCVYVATVRGKNGGQVTVQPTPGKKKRIRIYTYSKAGAAQDQPFEIIVSCNA